MSVFILSDTHWGHANILKYTTRPFKDVNHMDEELIRRWNARVTNQDTVYHLGDFSFGNPDKYIPRLNGKIFLVPGNHDRVNKFDTWVNSGKMKILGELHRCSLNGQYFTFCHYSLKVWDRSHYGAMHCYGHSHGTLPSNNRSIDVGIDNTVDFGDDYSPQPIEKIIKICLARENTPVDHHGE